MKKSMILLILLSLTSCSRLTFDALEFDRFISLSEVASHLSKQCSEPEVIRVKSSQMLEAVAHMDNYGQHRGTSPEILKSVTILHSMVSELKVRYEGNRQPSLIYCQEKLKTISITSSVISDTLGRLN